MYSQLISLITAEPCVQRISRILETVHDFDNSLQEKMEVLESSFVIKIHPKLQVKKKSANVNYCG